MKTVKLLVVVVLGTGSVLCGMHKHERDNTSDKELIIYLDPDTSSGSSEGSGGDDVHLLQQKPQQEKQTLYEQQKSGCLLQVLRCAPNSCCLWNVLSYLCVFPVE